LNANIINNLESNTSSHDHVFRYAYVEFADKDSVPTSLALDDSLFRGRQIKVSRYWPKKFHTSLLVH